MPASDSAVTENGDRDSTAIAAGQPRDLITRRVNISGVSLTNNLISEFSMLRLLLCFGFVFGIAVGPLFAQSDPMTHVDGISGTLAIVGGGSIPESVTETLRRVAGDNGSVVVLPDASEDADEAAKSAVEWLTKSGFSDRSRLIVGKASDPASLESLATARAVWICGGQQRRLADAWKGKPIEQKLRDVLSRGGMIAGTSAGAAIMSRLMIAQGNPVPEMSEGWDLMPDVIIDQHFTERERLPRLQHAVQNHPARLGMGIDEGTVVFCSGRTMKIAGAGTVTICLAPCSWREDHVQVLKSGEVADLTQLRRAARQRGQQQNPGIRAGSPVNVASGALVIVGGGAMPSDVVKRFVELAGGEKAHIVVLPTAVPRDQTDASVPGFLRRSSVAKVTVLTQRGSAEVDSGEFREALSTATGIWFGGGRQWNFVDAYEGTNAVAAFHEVLKRGGVIAGSSAGATIQGEFLVRGHPLGNMVMMADGYERGFAFLPGSAIDQHFAQRGRFPDLLPVVWRHSQMLGIGIDEGTALVVQGTQADVIGQSSVHFITRDMLSGIDDVAKLPADNDEAAKLYRTVKTGESIDLSSLKLPISP